MNWMQRQPYSDPVASAITRGDFNSIPSDRKMVKSFEQENPWPPPQFSPVDEDHRFCSWCGLVVDIWIQSPTDPNSMLEVGHYCQPYGKHCRHKDLDPNVVNYIRVTRFGHYGKHHHDPYRTQRLMVKDVTTLSYSLVTNERQETPAEIKAKERQALDDSMYDDDMDDCECCCDVCGEEPMSTTHCGEDDMGCHEKDSIPTIKVYRGVDIENGKAVKMDPATGYVFYVKDEAGSPTKMKPEFVPPSTKAFAALGYHSMAGRVKVQGKSGAWWSRTETGRKFMGANDDL